MKLLLPLVALNLCLNAVADEERTRAPGASGRNEPVVPDPLVVHALTRLEERMEIRFDIPFPANFDVDVHKKQPLALIPVDGEKVCVTRPMVNPFDEPRTVEWMMGSADAAKLSSVAIDCAFDLDEAGDFTRFNLI
ncbi:MAG: hypothetical protein ABL994_23680, partial [Verrucomicrobiales bacterium]